MKYWVQYESSFQVLADEKTIIGPIYKYRSRQLALEDVTKTKQKDSLVIFGKHQKAITTISICEDFGYALVGDKSGSAVQYDLGEGRSKFKVLRDYANLGIGELLSSASKGHLVVFGGNESKFVVIDVQSRRILGVPTVTAVNLILSVAICSVSDSKCFVCVTGQGLDYSGNKSDVFDFSELVCKDKIQFRNPLD